MGRIEFIIDKNLNKKVVVKNSDNILKEYRLLSSFDSQYIIKPISINGNQMVLPFYEERCADGIAGFCSEITSWHFLHDVASGLKVMHQRGFLHNDIQPSNIIISKDHFIISDLSNSHKLGEISETDSDVSSYAFSPQEWTPKRDKLTFKSDVWSLGASVFNLITGVFIFNGKGGGAQKHDTPLPSISTKDATLSSLVKKCLSFEETDRPSLDEIIYIAKKSIDNYKHPSISKKKISSDCPNNDTDDEIWPEKMIQV